MKNNKKEVEVKVKQLFFHHRNSIRVIYTNRYILLSIRTPYLKGNLTPKNKYGYSIK